MFDLPMTDALELWKKITEYIKEKKLKSVSMQELKHVWGEDSFHATVDAMLEYGLLIRQGEDLYQACTELEAKRMEESDPVDGKEPVQEEAKEEAPAEELPDTLDGPGEYYQVTVNGLGIGMVRTEQEPPEWKAEGLMYFENFWFLNEDTPMTKQMRNKETGEPMQVTVPRLRYWKAGRGAYLPISSLLFTYHMNRKDPLVNQIMKLEAGIVSMEDVDE